MRNNLLDTSTSTLNEILGNGKIYKVPLYQRDYSWKEENWEDLWEDIIEAEEDAYPHYMGAMVLQSTKSKAFTVIDGQQRLSTLSILAIACINQLKVLIEEGVEVAANEERVALLMKQYLGTKDAASLKYSSKLFLNENNNAFYQATILGFKSPINKRKLQDSDKLLWEAVVFFNKKVNEKFIAAKSGEKIATFLTDVIAEKLVFIQIVVDDDLSAYTVFETLNSRGVSLTSTDLLKNYLFSKVARSKTDLGQAKHQWQQVIDVIGLNEFPVFLRHYINSFDKLVSKEKLFKRLKSKIQEAEDVFNLLDELEAAAYLYQALDKPADDFWEDYQTKIKDTVRELKLFKIVQYKSLAIAAFSKLNKEEFAKVLHICTVISFRYQVIGRFNSKEIERAYNKAAMQLATGAITTARALFQQLKTVYITDETFVNSFATKVINVKSYKKLIRYILVKIEVQLAQRDIDFEATNATIEHILPDSYDENLWGEAFNEDEHATLVNRLGNHTLLESSLNNKAGTANFEDKKDLYLKSQYNLTKEITVAEWNPRALKHRQQRMAKLAKSVWKLDY